MKPASAKYLDLSLAIVLFSVFLIGYLVMEAWVFQPLPYVATPDQIVRHERAKRLTARLLQADSHFQVYLSRFLDDEPHPDIVLLDVDYDVVSEADAWPLPRSVYAEVFAKISEGDPKVVVVDLIYEKPQTPWVSDVIYGNITEENALSLMPVINELNHDGQLKEALSGLPYVLISVLANEHEFADIGLREKYAETLKRHVLKAPPVEVAGSGIEQVYPRSRIVGLRESILPLQINAKGQGFTLLNFDRYGKIAELPLFHRLESTGADRRSFFLPNIVTEAIRTYEGAKGYRVTVDEGEVRMVTIGSKSIRTTPPGEMVVNYYNHRRVPVIRAHDLLNGRVDPQAFSGKIVVYSSNTEFLHDHVETAYGLVWGAEVMTYALSNILNGDYFYRPAWSTWFEIGLLLTLLGIVLFSCSRLKPSLAAIAVLLVLGASVFLISFLYVRSHQIFSVTFPVSFAILLYLQTTLLRVIREERQKRFFKNALGLYLSPKLSEMVAEQPELLGLQGREEHLTVLFSDIRNFSSISETMTPEELTTFLQHYFSPMTDIIFETGGTLDKFIGDAIMAFWGAPLPQEDHARRACQSALKMLDAMDELLVVQKREKPHLPEIRMGIGVHSGRMRVGNMGSERRLNYTVIGDNVNLGSRLEGLTKHYGVRLIVSEETWELLGEDFYGRRLDRVRVKGKEEAVTIYEVIGYGDLEEDLSQRLVDWEKALKAYEMKQWDEAQALFKGWADTCDDLTARTYLEAIAQFREQDELADWPPVSVMTEK